jgi:hypothetical protein
VNASLPVKAVSGKKVACLPVRPTVPWLGCDTMRSVSALPSGSLAPSMMLAEVFMAVVIDASLTTAGRFGLALSFDGPRWQVKHPT